jgi:outer membrane protein assembly factor BamB
MHPAAACALACLLAADPAPRDQWPQWRGPDGNGTAPASADPPLTWSDTRNVRWKAPLTGRGSATPVVWGDQVFVVTAVQTDRTGEAVAAADARFEKKTTAPTNVYRFVVLSLDRATGKVRWERTAAERVPHEGHHPTHSYAAGSPAADGERLYVSFGSFGVYAFSLSGEPLWQRDLGRLNTRLGWGEAVTPVVHGDSVLLNWDQEEGSALYCLDARTGSTRWKADRPDEKTSWNTPLVVTHAGRTQAIVNGTGRARGYDLATGKVLWECGGMTVNAIPSPVAAGGVAYVTSGYRGSAAVAVRLDARGDVTGTSSVLWTYTRGTPYVPSPVLVNDRLWFTQQNGNLLTVLDTRTGKAVLDRERLPGVTSFYASPIAAAGRIYFVDRTGTTVVLEQSDKLKVLATNKLGDPIDASPVAVGRQLFLRGEKYLYCLESR